MDIATNLCEILSLQVEATGFYQQFSLSLSIVFIVLFIIYIIYILYVY